jgi:hypothetical protein
MVDGIFERKLIIYILDLTRSSCEKFSFRPSGEPAIPVQRSNQGASVGILRNPDSKKIQTGEKPGPRKNPHSSSRKPGLDL